MEEMVNDNEESSSQDDDNSVSTILKVKENDPDTTELERGGTDIQNMTDEELEELGRDISNNTHLRDLTLAGVYDGQKMSFFFEGLTRSSSIQQISLCSNGLSVVAVRSMVPFLQNANNLIHVDLDVNDLQSEGFNMLLRALRNSPIKELHCEGCGIESIEIDDEHIPVHLQELNLECNIINSDGCRGLAKLLQRENSALTFLYLANNKIDDEGVGILVDALQKNTSLFMLNLERNNGISKQGQCMLLKLVNNISSIKATLQSNHTLRYLFVSSLVTHIDIQEHLNMATQINREEGNRNPAAAARAKVIKTQLDSGVRAELAGLQGVGHSVYSEINPLHLPEVIALVGRHYGQGELYVALKSSIAGVISTINRKQCLEQHRSYHNAMIAEHRVKVEAIEAELATIEAAEAEGQRRGIAEHGANWQKYEENLEVKF